MSRGRHRAASARPHRLAALALMSSGALAAVLLAQGPVAAQAPDVSGWWNAANVGDPAPAPPPPPDVKDGDLFVQGSNAGPAGTPLGAAPASSQAISALAFDLQPSDLVTAMTLRIDGSPPPQVSVVACLATDRFTSADNGPWTQAPTYDGDTCVPGKLKGSDVVFAGAAKLVSDSRLAAVVLPGALDRVVFKAPGASTLTVRDGSGIGAAAPPLGTGTAQGPGAPPGGTGPSSTAPVGGSAVTGPAPASGGSLPGPATASSGSDTAPVVAPPSQAGTASPATKPVAATSGLSTRERRGIALGVIALEVLGYLLLMRAPATTATPVGAVAAAGGRLRAPDRGAPVGRGIARTGGVGRFRRERQGPAPQL